MHWKKYYAHPCGLTVCTFKTNIWVHCSYFWLKKKKERERERRRRRRRRERERKKERKKLVKYVRCTSTENLCGLILH